MEESTALVLGCGGLGTGVAMGLCRMGVKKLILVDMDKVEPSNLNRQILFTKEYVGMRKVDAAKHGKCTSLMGDVCVCEREREREEECKVNSVSKVRKSE